MPADDNSRNDQRDALIGLGSRSISKSYYPELRARLNELERFRALLDDIHDAIIILDPASGAILDIAGAAEEMVGCTKGNLVGMDFRKLLPPKDARKAKSLMAKGEKAVRMETVMTSPNPDLNKSTSVELSARLSEAGKQPLVIIVARDISERLAAEEELRKSHELLEERVRERTEELNRANQAKSEFLSVVSHELRTPLTSVLGFARIIKKKLGTKLFPAINSSDDKISRDREQVLGNLEVIIQEGDRLTSLINDLLDLAKLEAGRTDYALVCIPLKDIIHRAASASMGLFKDAGRELSFGIQNSLPDVKADPDKIVQVLLNLFSNAIKFSDNGPITCSAWEENGMVNVRVKDSGVGIPDDKLDAVFEKFIQAQEGLNKRPGGTGLGLPICRHIVEAHNGRIWAEAGPGAGTSIIFSLPPYCQD